MKKNTRRYLSLLLAVVMLASLFPVSAVAAEDPDEFDLGEVTDTMLTQDPASDEFTEEQGEEEKPQEDTSSGADADENDDDTDVTNPGTDNHDGNLPDVRDEEEEDRSSEGDGNGNSEAGENSGSETDEDVPELPGMLKEEAPDVLENVPGPGEEDPQTPDAPKDFDEDDEDDEQQF